MHHDPASTRDGMEVVAVVVVCVIRGDSVEKFTIASTIGQSFDKGQVPEFISGGMSCIPMVFHAAVTVVDLEESFPSNGSNVLHGQ